MNVNEYIKKAKLYRTTFLIVRYTVTTLNTIVGCFILSALVDEIFPLPIIVFHIYWFFILALITIFFINLVLQLINLYKNPKQYLQNELNKYPLLDTKDSIITSAELEQKLEYKDINFSKELAEKYIENIISKLSTLDLKKIVGLNKVLKVVPINVVLILLIITLYAFPPFILKESVYKILFTRKPEILGLTIYPKNIKVPLGKSCEIKVLVDKLYEFYIPILYLKFYGTHQWIRVNFTKYEIISNRKIYIYKIENVENKIFYKIHFRGISSKVYVIEPIVYPAVSKLSIWVEPPKYTSLKPIELQSFNEVKYLFGSKIKFDGETNKEIAKIKLITSKGQEIKINVKNKNMFSGEFVAIENMDIWFDILDTENLKNIDVVKYRINVIKDQHPEIKIISPEDEIIVAQNSKITLIYSAKDDIGISQINLNYYIENKKYNKQVCIKKYSSNICEIIDEYTFDLSNLPLNFGDVIIYYLTVYDNDTVSGPKSNISVKHKIEIFSFEKQHQMIERQVNEVIDKMLDYLSREIEFKEQLDRLTTTTIDISEIDKLINKKQLLNKEFEQFTNQMNDILSQMAYDPYTSVDTYIEFKSFLTNMENISQYSNPMLIDRLRNKDINKAQTIQQEIVDTLERLCSLTTQIMKKQNMENIANIANETYTSLEQLINELKNTDTKISSEQLTKLNNLLSEIEEKLKKIANMLQNQPQSLPEEFINRRDVKNIDLVSPQEMLQKLYSAISMGDIHSALKYAQQMLTQLESIMNILEQANSDILSSTSSSLKKELERLMSDLDNLIKSEEDIYSKTKNLFDYKLNELLKKQESILSELIKDINIIISKINYVNSIEELKKINNYPQYLSTSQQVLKKLSDISSEIHKKKLIQTKVWLKEAIQLWEMNYNIVSLLDKQLYSIIIKETEEILNLMKKLYDKFDFEPKIKLSPEAVNQNNNLILEQQKVSKATQKFYLELKNFGKKSFMITTQDLFNVKTANNKMDQTIISLENQDFDLALENENTAINLLSELRNKFSDITQQLQQMEQLLGKPMGSKIQYKSLPSGQYGVLFSRVKLPSVKDYIPPKELREDIIRSLSEKYPIEYNKIIQRYYKELLK